MDQNFFPSITKRLLIASEVGMVVQAKLLNFRVLSFITAVQVREIQTGVPQCGVFFL